LQAVIHPFNKDARKCEMFSTREKKYKNKLRFKTDLVTNESRTKQKKVEYPGKNTQNEPIDISIPTNPNSGGELVVVFDDLTERDRLLIEDGTGGGVGTDPENYYTKDDYNEPDITSPDGQISKETRRTYIEPTTSTTRIRVTPDIIPGGESSTTYRLKVYRLTPLIKVVTIKRVLIFNGSLKIPYNKKIEYKPID